MATVCTTNGHHQTDLIPTINGRTPFEAMTGRTAPSSDSLLAEVFLSHRSNARRSVHSPRDHFIITLIMRTDVTDATLGASGL